jgi:peptidoglycan/LPS O-acetylase OafA/YrhL
MVDLFIVLSGYVLAIPVVVASTTMEGGFWTFLRKRFIRIIPPFYVSLLLAFVVSKLPAVQTFRIAEPDSPLSEYIAHLFLINNWSHGWRLSSNQPLWSVAVEWQIYLLLPLVLLPIWRRFGVLTMVATSILGGIGFNLVTKSAFSSAHTWFVGLFALGILAAEVCHGTNRRLVVINMWKPIWTVPISMFLLVTIANRWMDFSESYFMWLSDTIVGFGVAAAIVALTNLSMKGSGSGWGIKVLTSKPIQLLGSVSYSVYLFHWPLLEALTKALLTFDLSADKLVYTIVVVGVPVIVGLCGLLSWLVEKPTLRLIRRLA